MTNGLLKLSGRLNSSYFNSIATRILPYTASAFLAVVLLAGGCAKKEEVVAKVGSQIISASEFTDVMLKRYRTAEFASRRSLDDRKEVLKNIIDNKLKLLDAYRKGIDKDSAVIAAAEQAEKQAAIQELYKVEILDKVIPPEAIRENYDKTSEEIKARHILFKSYADMAPNELDTLRARAEKCYEQLLAGADFDSMAKALSEDVTTAQRGGDLGYFTWGKMVDEFQEAAFALDIGEMSPIVKSSYGFHIILLEDRRKNENMKPFEEEEENIRMNLRRTFQKELGEAAEAYLEELKEKQGVKFDYANIQKILDKVSDPSVPRNEDYFSNFNEEEKNWVVATVGDDTINVHSLAEEVGKTRPPQWRDQKAIIKLVERMILPDMLADRAQAIGLFRDEAVRAAHKTSLENEMIRRVEAVQVDEQIDLSDETVLAYYSEHTEDFMTDSTVEVQEIYILLDEEAGKDKAFAERVASEAKSGKNFTRLVAKYSDRKSALGREGKIGPITSRQYGAMGKAAFELEIGEISDPIKMGRRGYSIVKLLDKTPARIKTFDECKPQVERQYRMKKSAELRDAWMAELEDRYNITIYEERLMAILPQPEPAEGDTVKTGAEQVEPKMRTIPMDKGGDGN